MISLLWSCTLPNPDPTSEHCFADLPEEGLLRLHPISCSAEIQGSFSRRGDWVLENSLLRVVVRHPSSSMSSSNGAGASIIELGTHPIFFEIRAEGLQGPLQEEHSITTEEATLRFSYQDVPILSYTIFPDEEILHIESEHSFVAIPLPESKQYGNTLYTNNREKGVYIEGEISEREQGMLIDDLQALRLLSWERLHEEEGNLVEVE